jgi:hypothetical protein
MNMSLLHVIFRFVVITAAMTVMLPLRAAGDNGQYRTFKKAIVAADNKDYKKAMLLYAEILAESPNHIDALTQLGVCLVNTDQSLDSALILFHKALNNIPEKDLFSPFGVELQRLIARTYNLNEQPKKALSVFEMLKDSVKDDQLKAEISREIIQSRHEAVLLKNPVPLKITNLGNSFNSIYDDHSPLVSLTGNRIFFTSRRPTGHDPELQDGQYPEKIFFSGFDGQKWEKPHPLGEFFSGAEHISILSLSPDGNRIFLFKNDRDGKSIYVSNYKDGKWQEPEKLPYPINSEWDETHASLSPDQSTLFFTSNRPGGYGGLDIYMVKMDEYGSWEKPLNLGPKINSEMDEETPMLHPDGNTLYFSSEGHSSMGRFDVFYSQIQPDGIWAEPVNMGYPVNTPDDDFFFVPTIDKSKAYYSSYRFSENVGRSDIYKVEFDSLYKGSLAVIQGTIRNAKNLPVDHIRILVSRESDNKQIGDYRPNPATGRYLLFLETGESYAIREVSPDTIEEQHTINVPGNLAYNNTQQVVMLQDPRMVPPLKPGQISFDINTTQLAKSKTQVKEIRTLLGDTAYTVQVLALKHSPEVGLWFFNGLDLETVNTLEGRDGFLRYVTGRFENRKDAEEYRSKIQKDGKFSDAWIRKWRSLMEISKNEEALLSEK